MGQSRRIALGAVAIIIVVVAFIVASGSSSSKKIEDTGLVQIHVVGGRPQGGIKPIKVSKGGRVRFQVTSDVADEIHVHGYNFKKDVAKNGTVGFDFRATIDGDFVIELESRSEQIAALQVTP